MAPSLGVSLPIQHFSTNKLYRETQFDGSINMPSITSDKVIG